MAAPTSRLQVVIPSELTNYCLNPSAESVGNYSAVGVPTLERSTTQARQVAPQSTYSYKLTTGAANQGVQLTTASLPSADVYVSAWVYVASGSPGIRFKINATTITPTLYETDGSWKWYVSDTPFTSAQAGSQTAVQVLDATGSSVFYVDDVTVTTGLCRSFHGNYPGCRWAGIAHQSSSTCFARMLDGKPNTKAGGLLYDLEDSWLVVSQLVGAGLPTIENLTRDTVAGKVYQESRLGEREMVLSIGVIGTSVTNLHTRRATLIDYIQAGQPFVLRWRGNTTYRGGTADVEEIEVVYSKGLEGKLELFFEVLNLGLTAYDPHWMPATATPTSLTMATSGSLQFMLQRTFASGWTIPGAATLNIYAMSCSPRGHIIVGGQGGNDNIKAWDPITATWGNLGALAGGNKECYGLAFDPSGQYLYATGDFTSIGGTSLAYIARYALPASTGVTGGTWSALGNGLGGIGRALGVATTGDLYVGGDFTTVHGTATAANYLAKWNGSAWSNLGPNTMSGSSLGVHTLAVTSKSLYFGGSFDTAGTIGAPTGFGVSNTTGNLASGNWGYCIASRTGDGYSAATSLTASGSGSTGKTLSWANPTGSTGTDIYREAAAAGGAAQVYYLTTVAQGVTSFTDTGQFTLNTAIEEPSTSTTGCLTKRVGRYDISGGYFASVGVSGMADGIVRALAVAEDGVTLYAVGSFTAADGATATRAAVSNGQDWRAMGDGLDSDGYCVLVDRLTNEVIVGGAFTASGPGGAGKMIMAWHPGTATGKWVHFDLLLPTATVRALMVDHNSELWLGGTMTINDTVLYSAQTSVTASGVGGGFLSYPTFYVTGPGILRYLENATTGHRIWFNMSIADSEIVTIQLRRGGVAITSTRLNGANRIDGFIDGDLGEFGLVNGINRIRVFYITSGGAVPSGNASIKIVDPGALLSADG